MNTVVETQTRRGMGVAVTQQQTVQGKASLLPVPSNIVTGTSSSYIIWVGSQVQYEAIATKDATTIYLITGS